MTTRDTSGSDSDAQADSSQWRQADKFSLNFIAFTSATGEPGLIETAKGVALVSQSCDVVLPHRPNAQVALIIELAGNDARAARDGKRSQYALPTPVGRNIVCRPRPREHSREGGPVWEARWRVRCWRRRDQTLCRSRCQAIRPLRVP
jgi:hypothetical protein